MIGVTLSAMFKYMVLFNIKRGRPLTVSGVDLLFATRWSYITIPCLYPILCWVHSTTTKLGLYMINKIHKTTKYYSRRISRPTCCTLMLRLIIQAQQFFPSMATTDTVIYNHLLVIFNEVACSVSCRRSCKIDQNSHGQKYTCYTSMLVQKIHLTHIERCELKLFEKYHTSLILWTYNNNIVGCVLVGGYSRWHRYKYGHYCNTWVNDCDCARTCYI